MLDDAIGWCAADNTNDLNWKYEMDAGAVVEISGVVI